MSERSLWIIIFYVDEIMASLGGMFLKKIIIPELTLLSSVQNRRELTLFSNPLLLSEMKDL